MHGTLKPEKAQDFENVAQRCHRGCHTCRRLSPEHPGFSSIREVFNDKSYIKLNILNQGLYWSNGHPHYLIARKLASIFLSLK